MKAAVIHSAPRTFIQSGMSCWFGNEDTIEANLFVHDDRESLYVLGASIAPVEYHSPLRIYQNAVEALQVSPQSFQPVAGR